MSEYVCPQTGLACPIPRLCQETSERTERFIEFVKEGIEQTHEELVEQDAEAIEGQEPPMTVFSVVLGNEHIQLRSAELGGDLTDGIATSKESFMDLVEAASHSHIESRLPFPQDPADSDRPHDEYFMLTQEICLRGTAAVASAVLELPPEERQTIIAELLVRGSERRGGLPRDLPRPE